MLIELKIQDFAIIDHLSLKFGTGFNIITGETGAGKSILIDAVDFALGGRADTSILRAGAKSAQVELSFEVPPMLRAEIRSVLEANDINIPSLERVSLSRELRENGRSSAKINDFACKITLYREIGGLLMDIHGQTDHLSLLNPKTHLYLLDGFAHLEDVREAVAEQVRKLRAVRQTMDSLQRNERERQQRIDMLTFQVEEIEAARLQADEELILREERNRLANAEKLVSLADETYNALYGEDEFGNSGINALHRAVNALGKLADLEDHWEEHHNLAAALLDQAEDLADVVRVYQEKMEVSPARLDQVEERLEVISRLKRKYGDSIKSILETAERARQELDDIDLGEERLEELQKQEDLLLHMVGDLSRNLSLGRQNAAARLGDLIEAQLADLKMNGARVQVSVTQEEDPEGCFVGDERLMFDATGIDQVVFLLSANAGEPLRPLAQVASGGETARIMLALKTVLTTADRTPSLIFDEIDQGIGGRLGLVVGEKLWHLADSHQVLVVTHLAQIAGFADVHFKVLKMVDGNRTITRVTDLNEFERLHEMAEMLGGVSESSLQNAQELYDSAQKIRQQRQPVAMF